MQRGFGLQKAYSRRSGKAPGPVAGKRNAQASASAAAAARAAAESASQAAAALLAEEDLAAQATQQAKQQSSARKARQRQRKQVVWPLQQLLGAYSMLHTIGRTCIHSNFGQQAWLCHHHAELIGLTDERGHFVLSAHVVYYSAWCSAACQHAHHTSVYSAASLRHSCGARMSQCTAGQCSTLMHAATRLPSPGLLLQAKQVEQVEQQLPANQSAAAVTDAEAETALAARLETATIAPAEPAPTAEAAAASAVSADSAISDVSHAVSPTPGDAPQHQPAAAPIKSAGSEGPQARGALSSEGPNDDPGAMSTPEHACDDGDECVVCWEARAHIMMQPCGHICICSGCAALLRDPLCPMCRSEVASRLVVKL